ncbi:MAG: aminotransferase class I/II-fold pyridoxal phosphate-dependent enzyme [Polyangiaceae bacterium]
MARLYLSPPHMGPAERELLLEAFDSNWVAPLGPHVDAFEQEFARTVDMPHAVALSSGTAALHLALILLGVGAGDSVWVSSLTFAATVNAIRYVGAVPVFVDSEAATWNMDPDLVEVELRTASARGQLPKALIAVDLYGQCADYPRLEAICAEYGVPILEDAAEALGARLGERPAGTFGAMSAFSFNGNKIITTSGGGMLCTRSRAEAERARFLATQARDPAPHYEHSTLGYNYRLSNLLAAVGRGQLQVLAERVAARRQIFERYRDALGAQPGIRFMPEPDGYQSTHWLTCLTVDPTDYGVDRERIRRQLDAAEIEARPVWKPMHLQPVFRHYRMLGGSVSEGLFARGLCLPSGSAMSESDQDRVIDCFLAAR